MAKPYGIGEQCEGYIDSKRCGYTATEAVEIRRSGTGTRYTLYLCDQCADGVKCEGSR